MIVDREQLLTPLAGQLAAGASGAAVYGSTPYDLKATTYGGNPAVGEPLEAHFMLVGSDVDNATNGVTFEIVADDDGAGTNEVSLVSKTVLLASLDEADGVQHIGTLLKTALAATNQYLVVKMTTVTGGTASTTGLIRVWLSKATDVAPNNAALQL